MRHRVAKVRLSRHSSHRIAMMRNMVTSLIEHERIETTLAKAKQLRSLADRMITLGKEGTLHARRRALAIVRSKSAVSKLFTALAERFKDRNGGYTRTLKLGFRLGDGAPMAIVEYVDFQPKAKKDLNKKGQPKKAEASADEKPKKEAKPKKEKKPAVKKEKAEKSTKAPKEKKAKEKKSAK
ncbi:MAG: 50S ribosomal protein L17 [Deltaproteobacteria bacterium]|nr:50S ribosomal protein L17 [Deltaproteobacteria bacterium]